MHHLLVSISRAASRVGLDPIVDVAAYPSIFLSNVTCDS
jgi:hypothetical protein